jgi:hypothetical protein
MRPTPYVASLRIYEPLTSFSPVDQLRWSTIPIESYTGREEQDRALRRVILSEPPSLKADGVHIIDHNGKRYVSPWSTAKRCWVALNDFKNSLPNSVIPFFLPESLGDAIEDISPDLESRVPHIISETWIIPPRWFALFSPDERLRGNNQDGPFTIMRTELTKAKKRCLESHQVVRQAFGEGPVEAELGDLLNWLNVFHPESILECDYGGLALYLEKSLEDSGSQGLESDTSIEDVTASLQGLANGDGVQAGVGYDALMKRWRRVAALEQAM